MFNLLHLVFGLTAVFPGVLNFDINCSILIIKVLQSSFFPVAFSSFHMM